MNNNNQQKLKASVITTTTCQQLQTKTLANEQEQKQELIAKIESVYVLSLKLKEIEKYISVKDPEIKTNIENM
eukprot:jgi/Orpsp1_1/1175743/evm.model.c7180000055041.1